MVDQRGLVVDTFYGAAYPLQGRNFPPGREDEIREDVAAFCLAQAGKHYNLNFLDSSTTTSFYCSQLVYLAYLKNGIDLNTDIGIPAVPGTHSIIFPQEIWSGCANKKA